MRLGYDWDGNSERLDLRTPFSCSGKGISALQYAMQYIMPLKFYFSTCCNTNKLHHSRETRCKLPRELTMWNMSTLHGVVRTIVVVLVALACKTRELARRSVLYEEDDDGRDWRALPPDIVRLVEQQLSSSCAIALAHTCKAWYNACGKRRVEPVIIFWDDKSHDMMLFQASKGWSPVLESCIPPRVHHPMLSVGPWLVSWSREILRCYNLVTKESSNQLLWDPNFTAMVAAGAISGTGNDDSCTRVLCAHHTFLSVHMQHLESFTFLLEEHDQLPRQHGSSYTNCPYPPFPNFISTSRTAYPHGDHMIVLSNEKCAFFIASTHDETLSLLLWYKWESDTWGCKSEIHTNLHGFSRDYRLIPCRPLVKINGKLGLVRCSQGHDGHLKLEICFLHSDANDLEAKVDCEDRDLHRVVMPLPIWLKFVDIVVEACINVKVPRYTMKDVDVTSRQCNDMFVYMFCTIRACVIDIIVYDVERDLWDVISFAQGKPMQDTKYFALPVAPDSYLAKVALSCKKKSKWDKIITRICSYNKGIPKVFSDDYLSNSMYLKQSC